MSKDFRNKAGNTEDVRESKLIQELRKQIIKLKRENSQLKKKNARIENDYADFVSDLEAEQNSSVTDFQTLVNLKSADKEECPKCGAYEVINFVVGRHKFFKCSSCETKGRVE